MNSSETVVATYWDVAQQSHTRSAEIMPAYPRRSICTYIQAYKTPTYAEAFTGSLVCQSRFLVHPKNSKNVHRIGLHQNYRPLDLRVTNSLNRTSIQPNPLTKYMRNEWPHWSGSDGVPYKMLLAIWSSTNLDAEVTGQLHSGIIQLRQQDISWSVSAK